MDSIRCQKMIKHLFKTQYRKYGKGWGRISSLWSMIFNYKREIRRVLTHELVRIVRHVDWDQGLEEWRAHKHTAASRGSGYPVCWSNHYHWKKTDNSSVRYSLRIIIVPNRFLGCKSYALLMLSLWQSFKQKSKKREDGYTAFWYHLYVCSSLPSPLFIFISLLLKHAIVLSIIFATGIIVLIDKVE